MADKVSSSLISVWVRAVTEGRMTLSPEATIQTKGRDSSVANQGSLKNVENRLGYATPDLEGHRCTPVIRSGFRLSIRQGSVASSSAVGILSILMQPKMRGCFPAAPQVVGIGNVAMRTIEIG